MGACYGSGILGFIPGGPGTEAEQIEFLEEFAALGLSQRFREVVGDRVLELSYQKGQVERQWLAPEEAAPTLAVKRSFSGSAPYTLLGDAFFPDTQILLPGFRGRRDVPLKLPEGHPFQGYLAGSLRKGMAYLNKTFIELQAEGANPNVGSTLWMKGHLLECFRGCQKHRLIFMFGY